MKDIENLIRENRPEWDQHDPPAGHERRFKQRLNQGQSTGTWQRSMTAGIAVALLVLVTINFFDGSEASVAPAIEHASTEAPAVPDEIKEVEHFYTTQVNRSMERIESIATPGYSQESLLENLERLEASSKQLQQALEQHPNDARILARLIENYKLRLQLTERHLMLIETRNDTKTTTHENS